MPLKSKKWLCIIELAPSALYTGPIVNVTRSLAVTLKAMTFNPVISEATSQNETPNMVSKGRLVLAGPILGFWVVSDQQHIRNNWAGRGGGKKGMEMTLMKHGGRLRSIIRCPPVCLLDKEH